MKIDYTKLTLIMNERSEEFTITLLSNASQDVCPNNTVYKFTNILAKELYFPKHEKWRVCLTSISMSNASNHVNEETRTRKKQYLKELKLLNEKLLFQPDFLPKFAKEAAKENYIKLGKNVMKREIESLYKSNPIFVECEEIKPRFNGRKVLSTFFVKQYKKGISDFITYEPVTEEYVNLTSSILKALNISIKTLSGEVLEQSVAQPSIVVLKFKKMVDARNLYTINITNDNQTDPADFTVNFPETLVKDGQQNPWEVAVSRISFSPLFKAFPEGNFRIGIYCDTDDYVTKFNVNTWDSYLKSKPNGIINFKYDDIYYEETFISEINSHIQKAADKINLKGAVTLDKDSRKVSTQIKSVKEETYKTCLILLPEELLYVLGYDGGGVFYKNGYAIVPTKIGKRLTGKREWNVDFLLPQNLLLYSDVVKPSLLGNVFGQYLTHIPIVYDNDKIDVPYLVHEPKNLNFHHLQTGDLNNIKFQLLQVDGKKPRFLVNDIKIFITILLRKR